MVNGNGEPRPPQPSMPLLEGVSREGQAGQVEEPSDTIVVGDAAFGGLRIFTHAPQFEWRPKVHVQGQDEEALQRIEEIEELLHRFGCKMEAQQLELYQRLEKVQTRQIILAKELYDLQHYALMPLASCFTSLKSLEGQVKQNAISTQQASEKVKTLVHQWLSWKQNGRRLISRNLGADQMLRQQRFRRIRDGGMCWIFGRVIQIRRQ